MLGMTRPAIIKASPAEARASGGLAAIGIQGTREDDPDAPLEERFEIMLRRVGYVEERVGDSERRIGKVDDRANAVARESLERDQALEESVKRVESESFNVRIGDAAAFFVGVGIQAVGTIWAVFC